MLIMSSVIASVLTSGVLHAQPRELTLEQLPHELRAHVDSVRASCRDLNPEQKPWHPMQGISTIDLDGDGHTDFLIDNRELCNDHMPGGNCSNRGCDLLIWRQVGRRGWKRIFKEHLHRKFVSIARGTQRFQMMAVSIYAGDPRCDPAPGDAPTSGQSCDLIVRYRNGELIFERIR